MLDSLITSKTRIKMLLKFFSNSSSSAYLREMAEEFRESTNSVRHELNNLSQAGFLLFKEEGRTIVYRANTTHPFYQELRNLVHKYLGIDKIVDQILSRLGDLDAAFVVGDYARGRDVGTIELVVVGDVDVRYLQRLVDKAKKMVSRDIRFEVLSKSEYEFRQHLFERELQIWGANRVGDVGKSGLNVRITKTKANE